jgi:aminomethyltransferase
MCGNDIDDSTSPIEAGLGWITKFTDMKDFIDKELLLQQKNEGVTRRLRGFEMIDRGIPRHGYDVVDSEGDVIGIVTSGTQSPVLDKGVGMGYINTESGSIGSEIYILVRNKRLKAKVVKMPFI